MMLAVVHKQTGNKVYEAEKDLQNYYGLKEYQLVRDTGMFDSNGVPILEHDTVLLNNGLTEFEVTYKDGAFYYNDVARLTKSNIEKYEITVCGSTVVETVLEPGKFYKNGYDHKIHTLTYINPITSVAGMLYEVRTGALNVVREADYKFFKEITEEEFMGVE